jgi:hypothetical protein
MQTVYRSEKIACKPSWATAVELFNGVKVENTSIIKV